MRLLTGGALDRQVGKAAVQDVHGLCSRSTNSGWPGDGCGGFCSLRGDTTGDLNVLDLTDMFNNMCGAERQGGG